MSSVNKVILVGNLGADPEMRYTSKGEAVCNLRLATTEKWKDKVTGETKEMTEWHRVILFRRLAEIAGQFLRKGSPLYVEGRIRYRTWQDRDAQQRFSTEIEASEMQLLGGRNSGDRNSTPDEQSSGAEQSQRSARDVEFGDVPF